MDNLNSIDVLNNTTITELNVGSTRLRRAAKNAGYSNIISLFNAPYKTLESIFNDSLLDEIDDLRDQYHRDALKFAQKALSQHTIDTEANSKIIKETLKAAKQTHTAQEKPFKAVSPDFFSKAVIPEELLELQHQIKDSLEELCETHERPFVYQIFDEYTLKIDTLNNHFFNLFTKFNSNPTAILNTIQRYLPDAFLLHVSHRANEIFDSGNLWDNIFKENKLSPSVQPEYKSIYFNEIERRNMPRYSSKDEAIFYYYTALLHAGFSSSSWKALWENCIIPRSNAFKDNCNAIDGRSLLNDIKNDKNHYHLNKSVFHIIEQSPASYTSSLLDQALQVGFEYQKSKEKGGPATISSNNLPQAAMQALGDYVNERKLKGHFGKKNHASISDRIIYFPQAKLELDLATGKVILHWNSQIFASEFAQCHIEYIINGQLVDTADFRPYSSKCVLDEKTIPVTPQMRYEVTLKLKDASNKEVSNLTQSFKRNKPGCFEFIQGNRGLYHLRNKSERITKQKKIAYVLKNEYDIVPGIGMSLDTSLETHESWEDSHIIIYDTEPGAYGAIVNKETRESISEWQEDYSARINKERIIGETEDGLDLYGIMPSTELPNIGLPSVIIEAYADRKMIDNLEFSCVCDNQPVSLWNKVLWFDEDTNLCKISVNPNRSNGICNHVMKCTIEVRQKSLNYRVIFSYKFAVAPISEFKLQSITFNKGIAMGTYTFKAMDALQLTDVENSITEYEHGELYSFTVPLAERFALFTIGTIQKDGYKTTSIKLGLAAIDILLPESLLQINFKRPICLVDAARLKHAYLTITSYDDRYNRAILLMLGNQPLMLHEFHHDEVQKIDVLKHDLGILNFSGFYNPQLNDPDIPLKMIVFYGDDIADTKPKASCAEIDLFKCEKGIGFTSWSVHQKDWKHYAISFNKPLLVDAKIEVFLRRNNKLLETLPIKSGTTETELSIALSDKLKTNREFVFRLTPKLGIGIKKGNDYPFLLTFAGNKDRE